MAVIGVRAHHGVVDILPLLNKGYDDPARVSQEEPDILFPRQVLWRDTGSAEALATRERSPAAEPRGCHRPAPPSAHGRTRWHEVHRLHSDSVTAEQRKTGTAAVREPCPAPPPIRQPSVSSQGRLPARAWDATSTEVIV